jgi:hypothetical protein
MLDILGVIGQLTRPALLVRTARFGVDDYRRCLHLKRLLRCEALPRSGEALLRLIEVEAVLNEKRIAEQADYSIARHIDVLIAIMGEARLLRATIRPKAVAD